MAAELKLKDDSDVFVVGDRNQRNRKHREHAVQNDEEKKSEMMVNQGEFEKFKSLVGPCYISSAIYGIFSGIYHSTKEVTFKNRPTKLIASGMINVIGRQTSKFANAGAGLCLLYAITRSSINFLFDDDLEGLTLPQKQLVYGFVTGFIFKSSRGLYPAILGGVLMSGFCFSISKFVEKGYLPKILI